MADEFDLKPTSRGEEFLDVILRSLGGDTPDIPQPAWRYEEYLAAIANDIQNGGGSSGGGVLVVHQDADGVLDKTWQEIHDACFAVLADTDETSIFLAFFYSIGMAEEGYFASVASPDGSSPIGFDNLTFVTNTADGYPVYLAE